MKTPEQQIQEARAALARAMARQKRADAHQKIVIGATAWNWFCRNQHAAKAFIQHVQSMEVRPQDRAALESAISELQRLQPAQPQAGGQQ